MDVTSEKEVASWLRVVEKKWGLPQIIIPNAGIVVPVNGYTTVLFWWGLYVFILLIIFILFSGLVI